MHRRACRLHDEDVGIASTLTDLDVQLTIGERVDLDRAGRDRQV
jgi:hypothetical protein